MNKTNFFRSSALTALALVVIVGCINAQRASIKTADGYIFIHNGKDMSYMLEVKGKSMTPQKVGDNPAFNTDGMLIQFLWIPEKNYDPTGKLDLSKLLVTHRDWEVDYLKTVFDSSPKPDSELLKISERDHLFWGFVRPKHAATFDRDYFITTLFGRDVIGLSSPVKVGEDLKKYKEKFTEIMQSLKISKKPFDINKLAEEIRNSKSN